MKGPAVHHLRCAAAAVAIVLLSGCAATASAPAPDEHPGAAVAIDNCGVDVETHTDPQRILTIKSSATELALALGLADRMVGTAFADGPLPPEWAAEAASIRVVSDSAPGPEAVLDLEPDFVFAGWESNLTADTAGERSTLARLGVGTYVAPSACKGVYQPDRLTFELLFDHFMEAGAVFGVENAAAELVADQRARLDAVEPPAQSPTAVWYSSGKDTPYVGAGVGAPQMMLDAAGLTNIVAGIDDTWTSLGWEAVIDADPDVIVLVDASWNTADSKIAYLREHAATRQLTAVREGRFIVVPFPASEGGVRSVDTVISIVDQLGALGFE